MSEPTARIPAPDEQRTLDPRVVNLWRLQALVSFGTFFFPVALVCAGALFTVLGAGAALLASLVSIGTLLVVLLIVQVLLWPPLSYDRFRYAVRDQDLWVARGVLFRQQSVIPHARIQHVDTRQGPLERIFGLSRLLVYTASGMAADGGIPGLDSATAHALRDDLAGRVGGEDGL
jgi:membrane protein YdbS with pleckstrin-like domain